MFTLPVNAVTDITGYMSDLFTDFSPIIFLIIGVTLGVVVIEVLVNIFRK